MEILITNKTYRKEKERNEIKKWVERERDKYRERGTDRESLK